MSDYTPSLEEAREQYWAASGDPRRDSGAWGEFDRMIETVRAEERERCASLIEPGFRIDYVTDPGGKPVLDPTEHANKTLHRAAARIRNQEAGE